MLHALLESRRPRVRALALRALAGAAWDGHVSARTLTLRARRDWRRWVQGVSVVATLRWAALGARVAASASGETLYGSKGGQPTGGRPMPTGAALEPK